MAAKETGLAFFAALSMSVILTPLVRMIALRSGLVDRPKGRKKHLISTPLLGGAAIYVSFALTILGGLLFLPGLNNTTPLDWPTLCIMMIASAGLMSAVGLVDDILPLRPMVKLLLQTSAAVLAAVFFIGKGAALSLFIVDSAFGWIVIPLTVIWLVGITNSMNLLDHADGLSAGTCTIAALIFSFTNLISGNYAVAFLSGALAGASLGFFFFNYNPASIFMGDCGSNMLGFSLGVVAMLGVYAREGSIRQIAIFTPLLILSLPLIDTSFVLRYRWRNGTPLFRADRNHLAHRLMRMGLSHNQAVMTLLAISALIGLLAFLLPTLGTYHAVLLFVHAVGLIALFTWIMNKAEKRGNGE